MNSHHCEHLKSCTKKYKAQLKCRWKSHVGKTETQIEQYVLEIHYFSANCVQFVSYFASQRNFGNEMWNGCWLQISSVYCIKHFRIRTTWRISKSVKTISQGQLLSWMCNIMIHGLYCTAVLLEAYIDMGWRCFKCQTSCNQSCYIQTRCCVLFPTWTKCVLSLVISLTAF
jgi:hypothetical protein